MAPDPDDPTVAHALRRVAERYAVAVDRRDGALFAAQFTEDGVLEAPRGRFAGRDALARVPGIVGATWEKTFHAVLNLVAEPDGAGGLRAETYCIARHYRHGADGARFCHEMTIRYRDRFVASADGWRLARRRLVVDARHDYPVGEAGPDGGEEAEP